MRRKAAFEAPASLAADEVAAWVEARRPDWAPTGAVDETVDQVLSHVELLVDMGVSPRPTA